MKKLYRLTENKVIAGVCSGIASYLEVDPVVIRLVAALGTLFFCLTPLFAYIIAWAIIPEEPKADND